MTVESNGFNPERISNVVNLSKEIKSAGLIGDTSPESAEKAREFLKKSFGTEYQGVDNMIEISRNSSLSQSANEKAKNDLDELGAAFLLAGGGKVEELACSGELNQNVSSTLHGIDSIVNSNLFVKNEKDEVGKLIVYKLREVEAFNIKAKIAPNAFESKRPAVVQEKIDALFDKYAEVSENSEEAMKLGAVIGHLDNSIQTKVEIDDEDMAAMLKTPRPIVTRGEDGQDIFEGGYGPDMATFTRKVLIGIRTDFRDGMPPAWYKNLTKESKPGKSDRLGQEKGSMEQWKYRIIAELADFSGSKLALKDGDLETLANKARPAMEKEEFKALYEVDDKTGSGLPGFKESLEVMVKDLFNIEESGLLSIKKSADYEEKFQNFFDYEGKLAEQLLKGEGLFTGKKPEAIKTIEQAKIAVGTAWNFLFIGDTVESADENRLLNPGKAYGDKVAAMFHPEAKLLRKFKLRQPGGKEIIDKGKFSGEEEAYGGSYGEWWFNRMSENSDLRKDVAAGKINVFPKRLAMSFVESFGVFAMNKNGEPEEMSMAKALHDGLTIVTNLDQVDKTKYSSKDRSTMDFNSDAAMMIKYRDIYQASYKIFNQLQGKTEIRKGEELKWTKDFKDSMALIRQNKIPGKPNYLGHVDDVDFLKIAIANSVGVKPEWTSGLFLNMVGNPAVYDVLVGNILNMPGLVIGKDAADTKEKILRLKKEFNAEGYFSSQNAIKKARANFERLNSKRRI